MVYPENHQAGPIRKGNYGIPPQNRRGKTLEHSRRQITEVETEALLGEVGRPLGPPVNLCVVMSVLHRLLGSIYVVAQGWFDTKAQI